MELSQLEANKQQYIEYCRYEKGLDRKTIKAYSTDTGQFIQFVTKDKRDAQEKYCKHTYVSKLWKQSLVPWRGALIIQYSLCKQMPSNACSVSIESRAIECISPVNKTFRLSFSAELLWETMPTSFLNSFSLICVLFQF